MAESVVLRQNGWTALPVSAFLLTGGWAGLWLSLESERFVISHAVSSLARLLFASEATHFEGQSGKVHGAIASGKRAAEEVLCALGRV
jgi:monoamine oxidase